MSAADATRAQYDPVSANPFLKLIGMQLESAEAGHAVFSLDLRPALVNVHAAAHGGVIMSILDAAMATAAMSANAFATTVVPINMSISFMRPGIGQLRILGKVVGGGKSISFCEGEVRNAQDVCVAKSMGSFQHRPIESPTLPTHHAH